MILRTLLPFVLFGALATIATADPPPPERNVGASSDIEEILSEWRTRASRLGDFQLEMILRRHARSASFGGAPVDLLPLSRIGVCRNGSALLLEAEGIAPPSQIALARADQATAEVYQQALEARFFPPYKCPRALSYQLARDLDSEQHLWLAPSPDQSTAMCCLPGESRASFNAPMISYVLEAFACLCVMPIGARRTAPLEYQLSPEIKFVSGRSCQVVQVWRQEKTKRRIIRELWIEKEVGYRIRQCIIPGLAPVKVHFEYSNDSENVLPGRITVVRLNDVGEVADELVAVAAPQDTETASALMSKKPLPMGTIVSDFILSQRKVANANGTFRRLSATDVASDGNPDRLIMRQNPPAHRWDLTLLHWMKWPRFIVLMGLGCAFSWAVKSGLWWCRSSKSEKPEK